MATIVREVSIDAPAERVWDALADIGALHTRLVPGFVADTKLEPGARIVTFGNGQVVKELIVTKDEPAKRLVWSATGGRLTHHNASAQVFAVGAKSCRFVWTADLLPDEMAPAIAGMIEQGVAIIKRTMEAAPAPAA